MNECNECFLFCIRTSEVRWNEVVDFELERQQIFQLYAGKSVLRKILYLENRVTGILRCFFLILENACKIFKVYLSVVTPNGIILLNNVLVDHELLYFI